VWLELGAGQTSIIVVLDLEQAKEDARQVLQEYEVTHPVSKDLRDCMPTISRSKRKRNLLR
jgi:hypothetical protein